VAELEFSFGNTRAANEAVTRSLALAPRNAQALALKGFLRAADNKTGEALDWFNRAIAADASLGNAWLGRGLCRIRQGDVRGGREDLLIAAAIEPRRAQLRSYLGKAYADTGDTKRALHELALAKEMDANDPTAWLYSALAKADHNRINEAIRDLEHAQKLNANRGVFRSELMIDADTAVQGVNLANIYRDAGMSEWALREGARAANYDYSSYSAHLFLAGSYNDLRDPKLVNLRYETAAKAEFLLANLLAPVSAGTLSPTISQQEYSRFFERDRIGVVSGTEYRSSGDWLQVGAQYGIIGNSSYSLEAVYQSANGDRPNNDFEQRLLDARFKHQFTPSDSAFIAISEYKGSGGDLAQYYDQRTAARAFRFKEEQEPFITLGYHHEWGPGRHTLAVANWLHTDVAFHNPAQPTLLITERDGAIAGLFGLAMANRLKNEISIFSTELQQIHQVGAFTTIIGARAQYGEIEAKSTQARPSRFTFFFPPPPAPAADQDQSSTFRRFSGYVYEQWHVLKSAQLIGGITYDYINLPGNFQSAPISSREESVSRVSPKAGLIWTPLNELTVRLGYSRSVGGATFDQSYQLEPSQIAGFVQSFRSIIPESVAGASSGARFETVEAAVDVKFPTGTYVGLDGGLRWSEVERSAGAFRFAAGAQTFASPSSTRQHLDYMERLAGLSLFQLLGDQVVFGARYQLTQSEFSSALVEIPGGTPGSGAPARSAPESLLHEAAFSVVFNHDSGFFAQAQEVWTRQENDDYPTPLAAADFWQTHLFAGYRFPRRRVELAVGILNVTDQDYRLSPLTPYNERPRERTFVTRLKINF
jgi:tetratricopeptide (TPR) repeat protein